MEFQNPFDIEPTQASVEDAMVAMYAILHMHEKARGKPLHLPLADAKFSMSDFLDRNVNPDEPRCGTAACAAGSAALSPWFHTFAKKRGIRVMSYSGHVIIPSFVCEAKVWGDAYWDMRSLFLGEPNAYGRQRLLSKLRAPTVKKALKAIAIKHFGAAAGKRCDAIDAEACIPIK